MSSMLLILQHYFTNRKKHSLVLKGFSRHHGLMNETTKKTTTTRASRVRTFLKYAWGDQVAANRALLRVPPYEDYLLNHRDEY